MVRAILFMVLVGSGCSNVVKVGPARPRPNVAGHNDLGRLVLAPSVSDAFMLPADSTGVAIHVTGWRSTLATGFANAFPSRPDGTTFDGPNLEVTRAELAFVPAAIGHGGTSAVRATIRYQARLVDCDGTVLSSIAASVEARSADALATDYRGKGMVQNEGEAVEALYEDIASRMLAAPHQGCVVGGVIGGVVGSAN